MKAEKEAGSKKGRESLVIVVATCTERRYCSGLPILALDALRERHRYTGSRESRSATAAILPYRQQNEAIEFVGRDVAYEKEFLRKVSNCW